MIAAWPRARAGEALVALLTHTGVAPARPLADQVAPTADLARWLASAAAWCGVGIEEMSAPIAEVDAMLAMCAPALVAVGDTVLVVVRATRRTVYVLSPELEVRAVALRDAALQIAGSASEGARERCADALVETMLPTAVRERASSVLAEASLRDVRVGGVYAIDRSPTPSLDVAARDLGVVRRGAGLVAAYATAQIAWVASWWALAHAAVHATSSTAWIAAWALLLVTSLAIRSLTSWRVGLVAIDAGGWIARRMIHGVMRCQPEVLARDGVGAALGRVLESDTVHRSGVRGALGAAFGVVELGVAIVVLGMGIAPVATLAVLVLVVGGLAHAARSYRHHRRAWIRWRVEQTHGLVEGMLGHATRLIQGDRDALARAEDHSLAGYVHASSLVDRHQRRLVSLLAPVWRVLALAVLAVTTHGVVDDLSALAITLGGVLLAAQAIAQLGDSLARIVDARLAWECVGDLAAAASNEPALAPPALALAAATPNVPALSVRALDDTRDRGLFHGCTLEIERGEHVLLEGDSGAGKSTFAKIVAGLLPRPRGQVVAGGLDHASVGQAGWRRRIAYAPQFHDNHVISAPLALNLLLARAWPPSEDDLRAAAEVCDELGLGGLLERMPGGLFQQVGEVGWQLSHGERSRLFLARALLQDAGLVILDESLGALDATTLTETLSCIAKRAPASLVIVQE